MARFKQERAILAMALESSLPWREEGDILIIPLTEAFKVQLLQRDTALIREALLSIAGRAGAVEFSLAAPGESGPLPSAGESGAELVCRVFGGTIVSGEL